MFHTRNTNAVRLLNFSTVFQPCYSRLWVARNFAWYTDVRADRECVSIRKDNTCSDRHCFKRYNLKINNIKVKKYSNRQIAAMNFI